MVFLRSIHDCSIGVYLFLFALELRFFRIAILPLAKGLGIFVGLLIATFHGPHSRSGAVMQTLGLMAEHGRLPCPTISTLSRVTHPCFAEGRLNRS